MKKKTLHFAALMLAALLLFGCAQQKTESRSISDTGAQETPQESVQESAPPEVENNGGYYVRLDDKIYFRRYGAEALSKVAVFGEFTLPWNMRDGESELMQYDLTSGVLTAVCKESGRGPLWYGDGGFYLCEHINGEDWVVWYAPDGGSVEPLCRGELLGISENGLLAVERTETSPSYHTVYSFYSGKTVTGELETEKTMMKAGVTDKGLFLVSVAYGEDSEDGCQLWQITPEGKLLHLGELPDTEEDSFVYDVQPDRFLAEGDKIAVGVGYYAGTGHFLDMSVFVEATVDREDSLQTLTPGDIEGENGELPRLAAGENGEFAFVPALPGELRIGWDEMGALEVWEDGEWKLISEHFAPGLNGGWGNRNMVQHMDWIGNTAYVTLACVHASPADDIGWREGYALHHMRYLQVERDGTEKTLSTVDHDAELYGNVWFVEGESIALWQQLDYEAVEDYWYEGNYAYAIPIAEDAWWGDGAFDGTTGLLPYDYGEGEVDYYGYPVPDTEPAGALCLSLDENGSVISLTRKDPDAVLSIEFDVPKEELAGAVKTLNLQRRDSDEDTPWYWARIRALENGVRVRLERTPEPCGVLEEVAMQEGAFASGETLFNDMLNCGEFLAVRVSLPWHPELRVSAGKDGAWGAYIFGEDNYLHLETEQSIHPEVTLAAYPLPNVLDYSGDGLRQALKGVWFYRSPVSGEIAAFLRFDMDGELTLSRGKELDSFELHTETDRLYAGEWDGPDMLCLTTDDPAAATEIGFDGAVGDYLVELFRTDEEEILHLIQANNGDGALRALLPDAETAGKFDYVFTRSAGLEGNGARRWGVTFPAELVRYDTSSGICWLREAKIVDEWEDGSPVWRANPHAPCLAYPVTGGDVSRLFGTSGNVVYPMEIYEVSVNNDGEIQSVQPVTDAGQG